MSDLDFSHLSPAEFEDRLKEPALQPPEGREPNFSNPDNLNTITMASLILCLILSTTFLLLRIYVKFIKIRKAHLCDC